MKLSQRITLLFSFAILLSIFIVSLISNAMINNTFDRYLVGEQSKKIEQISEEINELYAENDYTLYEKQIESYASLEDISIKIVDSDSNVLYSSDQMSNMHHMPGHMNRNRQKMMMDHGMVEGEYIEETFDLLRLDETVGSVIIGYIDNSFLTEGALIFKSTLTKILVIASVIAVIIGIVASILLSNSLTKPLLNIRNTSREIQKGNLSEKSDVKTNIVEIQELSQSINYLGETLSQQEAIRKQYASDISHELRTPLSTLKSHVEAIMDGIWEPNQKHLSILMDEIDRLSSLIDDLKDSFSSTEHGIVLHKKEFNLSEAIHEIILTFMPLLNKKNIHIQEKTEDNLIVFMDRDRLKQVMYNLLSNAATYTEAGGQIEVSVENIHSNQVLITVKDTGIGIPADHLPHVFDRFYRVDGSRTVDTGGTGLGLAIVQAIIEEHGGEITVKSVYGAGSEFIIYLPKT